jgi:NAD(P)-dependent dehydrogenase (short-subunit alcohol dehydrogenase family)
MAETVVVASATVESSRGIARRLAMAGDSIGVLVAGNHALQAFAAELVALGARAVLVLPCDMTDADEVRAAAEHIEDALGPVGRWINTAMTDYGYICGTRGALGLMRGRDRGTIIQVAAPRSERQFTEGLRGELALDGSHITVQCVRTQPFRRVGAALLAGAAAASLVLLRRVAR